MRTEVKLGVITSLIVVVGAGWYYMRRPPNTQVLPLGQQLTEQDPADLNDVQTSEALDPAADAFSRRDASGQLQSDPNPPILSDGFLTQADQHQQPPENDKSPLAALLASNLDDPDDETPTVPDSVAELTASVTPIDASKLHPEPADASPITLRRTPTQDAPLKTTRPLPPGTRTHTVQRGDTLAILAELYYGKQRAADSILQANPGINVTKLKVGTVLHLPPANLTPKPATSATTSAGKTYTVTQGDSFYVIARDQLGDANRWPELLELNTDLVKGDPKKLRPGQVLKLPK